MWFGGTLGFNLKNEFVHQRQEEVLIPYTSQLFGGEAVLKTTIDDLDISYRPSRKRPRYAPPPSLAACTRLQVRYEPSMLEYFYPYSSQRELLIEEEVESLRYERTSTVEDREDIKHFANGLKTGGRGFGGIVSEKGKANVSCYQGNLLATTFSVYGDTTIETLEKQRIKYAGSLASLRRFTPQIRPFELRMGCAANLRNLWRRLRFYDRATKIRIQSFESIKLNPGKHNVLKRTGVGNIENQVQSHIGAFQRSTSELLDSINPVYPKPSGWCDSMEWAFVGPVIRSRRHEVDSKMKIHVCPSVSDGLSTYAMNPNCHYDSPGDVVLLFETIAGWNQYGGPELFTFGNHDPKGGCALLNDGTVKFIRATEELEQLRWK